MAAPKPYSGENNTARCSGQKNIEIHSYRMHSVPMQGRLSFMLQIELRYMF